MRTQGIDLSEMGANIDNLLDVYVETQKENGIDVGLVECEVNIDNDGRVTKVKRDPNAAPKENAHDCAKCPSKCGAEKGDEDKKYDVPWYLRNTMGLFGEDSPDEFDDEDDDDTYICDYCSEIGYKKEYKPYICDICRVCETCSEYEKNCDGCSYSMYRTGELYSVQLAREGSDSYLMEDEKPILSDIRESVYDDSSTRTADTTFTVMNYDHKFS